MFLLLGIAAENAAAQTLTWSLLSALGVAYAVGARALLAPLVMGKAPRPAMAR